MTQTIAVIIIIGLASAWLVQGWVRKARAKTGCGCDHCPVAKKSAT